MKSGQCTPLGWCRPTFPAEEGRVQRKIRRTPPWEVFLVLFSRQQDRHHSLPLLTAHCPEHFYRLFLKGQGGLGLWGNIVFCKNNVLIRKSYGLFPLSLASEAVNQCRSGWFNYSTAFVWGNFQHHEGGSECLGYQWNIFVRLGQSIVGQN